MPTVAATPTPTPTLTVTPTPTTPPPSPTPTPTASAFAACGTQALSGGYGTTVNNYIMPSDEGEVVFSYDAYTIPDAFSVQVVGGGQTFVNTGSVSGSGELSFCKPSGITQITVTVVGSNQDTAWEYNISCPDNPCT